MWRWMQYTILVKTGCSPKNQTNIYRLHKLIKQMPFLLLKGHSTKKPCCLRSKWNHSALFCINCLHIMIPEHKNTNLNFLCKALSFLHLWVAKTAIAHCFIFVLSILHLMVVFMTTFTRRYGISLRKKNYIC